MKRFTAASGVRIVPGGSSIRDGCYVGKGVTCMPPMYINAGAYVGDGTMVDSHALVGSCAQVGKHCHISAASADRRRARTGRRAAGDHRRRRAGGRQLRRLRRHRGEAPRGARHRHHPQSLHAGLRPGARPGPPRHRRRAAGDPRRSRGRGRRARHHQRPGQGLGHLALHAGDRQSTATRRPTPSFSSKT